MRKFITYIFTVFLMVLLAACSGQNAEKVNSEIPENLAFHASQELQPESAEPSLSETAESSLPESGKSGGEPGNQSNSAENKKVYECLYPVYLDGGFEYMDRDGNIVTDEKYEEASFFFEGMAGVKKDGKYGAIDLTGSIKIPLSYEDIGEFHCGLARIKDESGLFGYINRENEIVIPCRYEEAWSFSENVAVVTGDRTDYCAIDIEGNKVFDIDFWYRGYIDNMHGGRMRVGYAYYDEEGGLAIDDKIFRANCWEHAPHRFSEGVAVYPVLGDVDLDGADDYDYIEYYMEHENELVDPDSYEFINYYMHNENWKYNYIDKSGKFVFDEFWDYACDFQEGLAVVRKGEKYGVINQAGELLFETDYLLGEGYSEGLVDYMTKTEDGSLKWGFLDTEGREAANGSYDYIQVPFRGGLALVGMDGELAYIDHAGNVIIRFEKPEFAFWRMEYI